MISLLLPEEGFLKTIIVDDEPFMLKSFARLSDGIKEIEITGMFEYPADALAFARANRVDLAVLDISMPGMSGLELAAVLRTIRPDMLIVFITAYDNYIAEANRLDADYYIVKPYKRETMEMMAKRMSVLASRQAKALYVQTFGKFNVLKNGEAVPLSGKAKEILALVVTRRGKEISNEEIYTTIWEEREYSNVHMKVYYNALKRLKDCLEENGIAGILQSTPHGQMVNTDVFDCDYYAWQDSRLTGRDRFEGEFMSEYSWGEYILADMMEVINSRGDSE